MPLDIAAIANYRGALFLDLMILQVRFFVFTQVFIVL